MSLQTLVQSASGQGAIPAVSSSSKGLGKLVASSKQVISAPSAPPATPQSFGQKFAGGVKNVTDFLGLGTATDVIGQDIAHATADDRTKALLPLPSASQNLGASLQVGSFLIPAFGAERIAGSVATGALTRAAIEGSIAGGEYGLTSGAGESLAKTPTINPGDIIKNSLEQGGINAAGGALLGLGGALASKGLSKLLSKSKPLEEATAKGPIRLPVQSENIERNVPIETPTTKHAEYAKSQGYEPIVPPEQLPVIQAGRPAPSTLPTIQTIPKSSNKLGDLTIEPIPEPKTPQVIPETPNVVTQTPKVAPKASEVTAPIAKSTPPATGTKVSKIAGSIDAKAVENNLTTGFKDLAGYDPKTIKDQSEKISNLMNTSMDDTRAIVRGEKPVPEGVSGTYLIKAVEDHAIAKGDGEILRELASSPLTSETSRYAQELRMAAERNPESPLKAISDINKARETKIEKNTPLPKARKAVVSDIQKEILKSAPKKEDWNSFIDTLTC